jgi:hypothetical protein
VTDEPPLVAALLVHGPLPTASWLTALANLK